MQTLQEYAAAGMGIAFHAKNIPDKKAIVSEHGERTFQELNENSNRYANFLCDKGLKPGDGVAIVCSRDSSSVGVNLFITPNKQGSFRFNLFFSSGLILLNLSGSIKKAVPKKLILKESFKVYGRTF